MVAVPTNPFALAVLAVAAVVAVALLAYGLRELQLAVHVLRSRPNSVLDTTDGGPVELRGTAEPIGRTLESPFTGTECLVYEYEVHEEHQTKNGRSWRTIDSGEASVPFLLDDGSAKVVIEPPGASVRLERSDRIEVDGGTAPPPRIARYIDETEDVDDQNTSVDLRVFELKTGDDRRFIERRLDVGEDVHVLGTARYDTTVSKRSGQVNAAVGVGEAALSDSRWVRLRHRLLGYPFVISDRSERRLGWTAACLGAGAILGAGFAVAVATVWLS